MSLAMVSSSRPVTGIPSWMCRTPSPSPCLMCVVAIHVSAIRFHSLRDGVLDEVRRDEEVVTLVSDQLEVVPTRAANEVRLARFLTPAVDLLSLAAVAPDELATETDRTLAAAWLHVRQDDVLAPQVGDVGRSGRHTGTRRRVTRAGHDDVRHAQD